MNQKDRVLAALKFEGARGITQVDFLAPHVYDDGEPITRVPARIKELRDEGHPIVNGHIRNKCRIFRLLTSMYKPDENGCWIWGGTVNAGGYGMLDNRYAHRIIYERERGPIPEGMELDHLCRTRRCVNPDHLEAVSHTENVRRGAQCKLTAAQVEEIRSSSESNRELAERYGVHQTTILRTRSGELWSEREAPRVVVDAAPPADALFPPEASRARTSAYWDEAA